MRFEAKKPATADSGRLSRLQAQKVIQFRNGSSGTCQANSPLFAFTAVKRPTANAGTPKFRAIPEIVTKLGRSMIRSNSHEPALPVRDHLDRYQISANRIYLLRPLVIDIAGTNCNTASHTLFT